MTSKDPYGDILRVDVDDYTGFVYFSVNDGPSSRLTGDEAIKFAKALKKTVKAITAPNSGTSV